MPELGHAGRGGLRAKVPGEIRCAPYYRKFHWAGGGLDKKKQEH